jgi:2-polyprenyl-6-methoxyphenol hydroxylase-like FAD-dependent oxidoreductase
MTGMDIAVLGAGIGGLTTALALQRRGLRVTVYEAAPEIRAVGAGIWMPPNAMRLLDALGVGEAVRAAGVPLDRIAVTDLRGRALTVLDRDELEARFGAPTVSIARASLHALLAGALTEGTIALGKECVGVRQDDARVELRFADDTTRESDLLVAADGLRSVVRRLGFPARPLRDAGQRCFRGLATIEPPPPIARASAEVWGHGVRFGASPVGPGRVYWYTTVGLPTRVALSPHDAHALLRARFAAFPGWVREVFDAIEPPTILEGDLADLTPGDDWVRGRVALLGDAAHATTPNLGQGAAMAIEDGVVLAAELARGDGIDRALAAYVEARRARVRRIVDRSWTLGRIAGWRNPVACAARDLAMRAMGAMPAALRARPLAAIYDGPVYA